MPMYSLSALPSFEAKAAKKLIHNHNGDFAKNLILKKR
jgi:hypothetical protein